MYNAEIAPLVPFALRGVLWYQGESNVGSLAEVRRYADEMYALICGWRHAWGDDFPFCEVQIAPFAYHANAFWTKVDAPDREPLLWEQQADVLRLPRTGMVVTNDITDDVHDIHPRDKRDVGERLARWALATTYGHGEVATSGPLYRSMQIVGGTIVVHFDHAEGLRSRDGKPLTWFEIAGSGGAFVPASANIVGDAVVVASSAVPHPMRVRFAWNELARPNLCNQAGLPAAAFRTDPEPWTPPGPTGP
jgi:sialate O-acetylesterase